MIVRCKVRENVWSAAEAAEVTGVSPLVQRAWRNRGFLGARRHARGLTSMEVAQVRTLKIVKDRGVDLDQAAPIAERARDVLWFAVSHDPLRLIEPLGTFDQQRAFKSALKTAVDGVEGDLALIAKAVSIRGRGAVRFVAAIENDQIALSSLGDIFDAEEEEAALILDLLVIGRRLAELSSRPLLLAHSIVIDSDHATGGDDAARLELQVESD